MNLVSIPAGAPFLDLIARAWLEESGPDPLAIADGLILLPTRRAARALAEAFLRAAEGRPMLLPRITALGAADETPLALSGALDLPPAVDESQRLAALARLILGLGGAGGAPRDPGQAWTLAGELAALMDEAEAEGVDLRTALPDAADPEFAEHWRQTLQFLAIVTEVWPTWLAEQGRLNPAARRAALLEAQARAWQDFSPSGRIWAAGMTAAYPAVAKLLRVIARLPKGLVVLPGLDRDLPDAAWAELPATHPQAGLARLLAAIDASRGDVRDWPGTAPSDRARFLALALRPAGALADWRVPPPSPAGLVRLDAADPQQEAAAIALRLRATLETPGARAALVTPDRALAARVSAELRRFGIVADDSAGENLSETPPAVLLRLLAEAVAEELAPVPLLALLKHPLTGLGLDLAYCRRGARALERACLRGPRPGPGLSGLRRILEQKETPSRSAVTVLTNLEACLRPLLLARAARVPPATLLTALVEAAEGICATDGTPGPARLWAEEEGEVLAAHVAALGAAFATLPDMAPGDLPALLEAALIGPVVRSRRALRGGATGEHPRVFIWGLLEARLQSVDVAVLGGLVEGVWPPATDPGPWMGRPMRTRVGLPSPETRIGQAAHDFLAAASAAGTAVLSAPRRRDNAPAVPARFLARIDALLAAHGQALPADSAAAWARALDEPLAVRPVPPPAPRPPAGERPKRLSVTEIGTFLANPYAIHARHVLKLSRLDDIDQAADQADYGSLVHDGLHEFLKRFGAAWPADALDQLTHFLEAALDRTAVRPGLANWWRPRVRRIAAWVAARETERRARDAPEAIGSELKGELALPDGFTLSGRADRIERYPGRRLIILDYKTGQPPSAKMVRSGIGSQLPLEAMMCAAGAFGPEWEGEAEQLLYWRLAGGAEAGEESAALKPEEIAEEVAASRARLIALLARFSSESEPYRARPNPEFAPAFDDYAQLARVAEWVAAEE